MSPMVRMDAFTVLMDQAEIQIPCERPLRDAEHRANGLKPLPNCGGDNPAEWVLWFSCPCPPPYVLYCTFCKDQVLAAPVLECNQCGLHAPPGQMYRLIEPLNKAAA